MLKEVTGGARPGADGGARVLIYSHDTFGLGHLRRCLTIANSLVENHKQLSALILSGSPIIGRFDFRARVDFVRVPGVIKLRNGEYTALNLHIDVEQTLSMRASIIQHTAEIFDPNIFIVDKEPLGLRGEVHDTLKSLKGRGTRLVLGLRDVLDEPALLVPEWERKNIVPGLEDLYDEIWIYGLPQICEPLAEIGMPASIRRRIVYTGYLPRAVARSATAAPLPEITRKPYMLVTTGGGGDGVGLIEWVMRAYESDSMLPYPALLVLGPFMAPEHQADFKRRAARLARLDAITFSSHMEELEANAAVIVAMGGYNTFCEILSLDKRALIVPRTVPRREQFIRATRAQELGLVRMLDDNGEYDAGVMAAALRALPGQPPPSNVVVPGLLEGLDNVNRLAAPWLQKTVAASEPVRRPA
jgi:predicted glycosyltransferase